jgi:hypothetical protein
MFCRQYVRYTNLSDPSAGGLDVQLLWVPLKSWREHRAAVKGAKGLPAYHDECLNMHMRNYCPCCFSTMFGCNCCY